MILIRQAKVYAPECLGVMDVLVAGSTIEAMADHIEAPMGCTVIEAEGKFLTPGLIDQHEHIIGGGGEGSFHTRTPEIMLSAILKAGITTVVGLLGTDDMSRTVEDLLAKTKALNEEGITAYNLCGAYGLPSPTITGSVKKDIAFIQETLGLKLALSDHRSPNVTLAELIRLASDTRVAGMISGKPGFITLHMGDGEGKLDLVFEALKTTDIPAKIFHPTHTTRTRELTLEGFKLAKLGGYMDITCEPEQPELMPGILREAKKLGVPMDHLTFSSDGQGSWSNYDASGNLVQMGVTDVACMYEQLVNLLTVGQMNLSEALPFFTSNVAKALELYPKKGCIASGSDADLLLIRPDFTLDTVIAKGKVMMEDAKLKAKGTYE